MNKGKIVFISSIHGKLGHGRPTAIGYSASKARLDSYMKNLAKAIAPDIFSKLHCSWPHVYANVGEMDKARKAELALANS